MHSTLWTLQLLFGLLFLLHGILAIRKPASIRTLTLLLALIAYGRWSPLAGL